MLMVSLSRRGGAIGVNGVDGVDGCSVRLGKPKGASLHAEKDPVASRFGTQMTDRQHIASELRLATFTCKRSNGL